MVRAVVFVLALLTASAAFAQTFAQPVNLKDLTSQQLTQLQLQADQMRGQNNGAPPTAANMKEWSDWGQGMGVALAATARELGVAVEDFSQTNVGRVTIAIIVWKLIGNELVHYAAGSSLFLVLLTIWISYYRKMCVIRSIEYGPDGKKKSINYYDFTLPSSGAWADAVHGTRFVMGLILAAIVAVCNIIAWSGDSSF